MRGVAILAVVMEKNLPLVIATVVVRVVVVKKKRRERKKKRRERRRERDQATLVCAGRRITLPAATTLTDKYAPPPHTPPPPYTPPPLIRESTPYVKMRTKERRERMRESIQPLPLSQTTRVPVGKRIPLPAATTLTDKCVPYGRR